MASSGSPIPVPASGNDGNDGAFLSSPEDWQCNQSVLKRNQYMLEHSLATDVTFIVGNSDNGGKVEKIQAHKYILISGSPVFWSMFQGELREEKDVEIPDVEPQIFMEMLKFLYYEKANLTCDSVTHILYISKKYIIPALTAKCTEFLEENMNADNVCVILVQCLLFTDKKLQEKCMKVIRDETKTVLQSDGFRRISLETLLLILDSNELNIDEVEILNACLDWAKNRLQHENENPYGQNENETRWRSDGQSESETKRGSDVQNESENVGKFDGQSLRKQLGVALYKIRFTQMSFKEFCHVAVKAEILSQEEENLCFRYFSKLVEPEKIPFETLPRKNSSILKCQTLCRGNIILMKNIMFQLQNVCDKSIRVRGFQLTLHRKIAKVCIRSRSIILSRINFRYPENSNYITFGTAVLLIPNDPIEITILLTENYSGSFEGVYGFPAHYSFDDLNVLLTPQTDTLVPLCGILFQK